MSTLDYIVHHVFMPPKLPQKDDYTVLNEIALCQTVHESASRYLLSGRIAKERESSWNAIVEMLQHLTDSQSSEELKIEVMQDAFSSMREGCKSSYYTAQDTSFMEI
jgi:hypothetical protein